jgi:hypothetical protein
MSHSPSDVRDFVIGIDYDDIAEDRGHLTLRRKVSLSELLSEIIEIMTMGCTFPQFPPEANPSVTYAWDLNDLEDGDCYGEIINELEKHNQKEGHNSD